MYARRLFGPIRHREHAHGFAGAEATVKQVPHLRALLFCEGPSDGPRAEGKNTLLGAARFLVTAGAAERSVETIFVEGLFQSLGFQDIGMDGGGRGRSG